MRVETLGEGTPSVAVVAAVHGDEPCGVRAVERLLAERPPVREPVDVVVANERARSAGVRYVDEDLNRAFPGDPDADTHEGRLAARLQDELAGRLVFSLHSTRSHAEPFAFVDEMTQAVREVVPRLPVVAAVESGPFVGGRLAESATTVEVECGLQGTDAAAENADRLVRAFLTATGVLPGDAPARPVPHFRLCERIPKTPADRYEVFAENFTAVDAGEPFAAADGEPQVADDPFYPVLLSVDGYEHVFGYAAEKVGELGDGRTTN